MQLTISHEDKPDHVIAVVEALYGIRLQQVEGGGGADSSKAPTSDGGLPGEGDQGATKPRHG